MSEDNQSMEPSSGYDLMAFTEKNVNILIDRIRELRSNKNLTYIELWKDSGLAKNKSESALSRWVNKEAGWDTISKSGHEALVMHLIERRLWYNNAREEAARAIPDVLFHSVTDFLGIGHATKENIRKRAKGVFRVYHPSLILEGRYVVGVAQLTSGADSDAVSVTEYFRYVPDEEVRFKFRTIDEAYDGYLFRKSKKYFSLLRDRERTHMRMEVFPDTFGVERDIKMFRGAVMSISENRGFYAPIYYEKVEPKPSDKGQNLFNRVKEESNIYEASDLPEIVRAHLNATPPSMFG